MVQQTRIMNFRYRRFRCEIVHCTNYAVYVIRRHDLRAGDTLSICKECANAMLNNLPPELSGGTTTEPSTTEPTDDNNSADPGIPGEPADPAQPSNSVAYAQPIEDSKEVYSSIQGKPNVSEAQQEMKEEVTPEKPQPAAQPESNETLVEDRSGVEQDEEEYDENQKFLLEKSEERDEKILNEIKEVLYKSTVDELREHAQKYDIDKYYEMRKDELVEAIAEKELIDAKY